MVNDVTVIIRSAGERTINLCRRLSEYQIPSQNVFVIQERPFHKAVEVCFKLGIEEKRKWTLALDADILLESHAIENMVRKADSLGENLYIFQGTVLDKIYGEYRYGGPHLYQTRHLENALEILLNNPKSLRPESATYKKMSAKGYFFYNSNICFGIHEYDQFLADYFRKGFLHAKKTPKTVLKRFLNRISEQNIDPEIQMALNGFSAGILYNKEVSVDINFFQDISTQYMTLFQIEEKKVIEDLNDFYPDYPDSILSTFNNKNPGLHFSNIAPFYLNKEGKRIFQYKEIQKNPITRLVNKTTKILGLPRTTIA